MCLRDEVSVECANDDPGMVRYAGMQVNKVLAIQCDHGTLFANGKRQDLFVRHRAERSTGVLDGQNIVPQPSELLDNREREVLVPV